MVWALGVTQVIGYGTLYYGFGVLAPAISAELGWGIDWVYGALSLSLLAGGLGFWWAWLDRNGLAWHDRVSGTRMIREAR